MSGEVMTVRPAPFWTWTRVADALTAESVVNLPHGDERFHRVWTDTRTIEHGDLFVALVGERFDAHEFLADAVAKGATGVVVSDPSRAAGLGVPVFAVNDTLAALGALAAYRRRAWAHPVVGIVGTNGKTSTKELVRAALGSVLEVHATTANYNNLIGVPLTLLAIPAGAEVAVVEMGTNQPGEIARLRDIVAPDILVVTSIAEEHLEGLGDIAGVMREEMAAADGTPLAIVPAAQPEVVVESRLRAARTIAAGLEAGDFQAKTWSIDPDATGRVTVVEDEEEIEVHVPLRGVHNLRNAMLALAVARECGIPLDDAARGIASMPVPPMRSNVEQLGKATLINDAYNANPGSTRAALELLVHAGAGRPRVAVLGSMLELGAQGPALHDAVLRDALDAGVELVIGVGEYANAIARLGAPADRAIGAPDAEAVWPLLESRLGPDSVILLKGSRGVKLERIVPHIEAWAKARA